GCGDDGSFNDTTGSTGHGATSSSSGMGGGDPFVDPSNGAYRTTFGLPGANGTGTLLDAIAPTASGFVVAGHFQAIGDVPARNVARFEGEYWSAIGDGVDAADLHAVAFDAKGTLYVGGETDAGEGVLAAWDGSKWSSFGVIDGPVRAIAAQGSTLLIGG